MNKNDFEDFKSSDNIERQTQKFILFSRLDNLFGKL